MVLLLPIILLALTPLALVAANRLQPGFRSNWLVAVGGALLACLALIALRFRVPLNAEFAGWSLSSDLQFPFTLSLNPVNWLLALALPVLLLLGLAREVRQAMSAAWLAWAPGLLLAAAAMLATVSGDLLSFAFSFFLLDLLTLALHLSANSDPEGRRPVIDRFTVNSIGVVVTLAAWALSFAWPWLSQGLLLVPVALRLGVFTPRLFQFPMIEQRRDLDLMLRFAVPVSSLAMLLLWQPLAHVSQITIWILFLLLGLLVFVTRSPRPWLPQPLAAFRQRLFALHLPWPIGSLFFRGVEWTLDFGSGLLEGEAGVLWALLLVALLLSLAAQLGLAS
jgi:hypothetical protein